MMHNSFWIGVHPGLTDEMIDYMNNMVLEKHKQDWEDLGKVDPLWAIYTDSTRRYGKWDLDEFFRTGEEDVAGVLETAAKLDHPAGREAALDFGCGIGRLTRALAKHFQQCVGVDISATMIQQASKLNQAFPNCRFIVNNEDHLQAFADHSFDMIYTKWVLQHLPNKSHIRNYVAEFVRMLKINGLLVFQVRTGLSFKARLQVGRRLYNVLRVGGFTESFLYRRLHINPIRMTSISEGEMTEFLCTMNARILEVQRYHVPSGSGATYFVTI
jgi:ubiquinone/menaquinone biosynthesis C-methylase UbiE